MVRGYNSAASEKKVGFDTPKTNYFMNIVNQLRKIHPRLIKITDMPSSDLPLLYFIFICDFIPRINAKNELHICVLLADRISLWAKEKSYWYGILNTQFP